MDEGSDKMIKQAGFTLIEVFVVIAILGIILAIALPFVVGPSGERDATGARVIHLPPGQTLNQIVSTTPLSYTTRARQEGEPMQNQQYREPGLLGESVIIFQEH
jgi:prepilin-type N-terminal cleavage/methylation domain-containing protein